MRKHSAWVTGLVVLVAWLPTEPVLAQEEWPASRLVWGPPDSPFDSIERDGWTIPGPFRRRLRDRWLRIPERDQLRKAALTRDVYDLIFMGQAYHHGHRHESRAPWRGVEKDPRKAEHYSSVDVDVAMVVLSDLSALNAARARCLRKHVGSAGIVSSACSLESTGLRRNPSSRGANGGSLRSSY